MLRSLGRVPDRVARAWRSLVNRSPRPISRALRIGELTLRDAAEDRVPRLAAEIAFYAILALPSALLAVLGMLGYLFNIVDPSIAEEVRHRVISVASTFLTQATVEDIVRPTMNNVLERGSGGTAVIWFSVALWLASRATAVVMEVMRIAFEEKPRSAWRRRIRALGYTFGMVVSLIILLPIFVVGPEIIQMVTGWIGLASVGSFFVEILYWPVAALAATALVATFYHLVLPRDSSWWSDVPGAFLAVVMWILGGLALRVYAAWSLGEGSVFGPLGSPIALLLLLYVTGLALLLGVEFNSQMQLGGRPRKGSGERPPRAEP